MTSLMEETLEEVTVTEDGEHDRFAHYYLKKDLALAWFEGIPITAACGKTDIPTRDFTKYPVCPTCKEVYESRPID